MDYRSFTESESFVVGHYDDELVLKGFFNQRDGKNIEVWKLVYEFRGTPMGQVLVRVQRHRATAAVMDILIESAPHWKGKAERMVAKTRQEIRVPKHLLGDQR